MSEGADGGVVDGASLEGVSATSLWTLRNRAVEAMRTDGVLDDPLAVGLYQRISYDYGKFGKPSQSHALRALAFDEVIRDYAREHPRATVVALGEGLQTSYWRIADPDLTWVSVDLPEVMEVRRRLLPEEPGITPLAMSALDRAWMDRVDEDAASDGIIITAEGLLMYLPEADSRALIADCAARFPGGAMVFDSIPPSYRDRTLDGLHLTERYQVPPMPFSLTVSQAARLAEEVPHVSAVRDVMVPRGRGPWANRVLRKLSDAPFIRDSRPAITVLSFG